MTDFERERLQEQNRSYKDKFSLVLSITNKAGKDDHINVLNECIRTIAESTPSDSIQHFGTLENNITSGKWKFTDMNGIPTNGNTPQDAFFYFLLDEFSEYRHTLDDRNTELAEKAEKASEDPDQEPQAMIRLCCVADVVKKPIQFLIEPYIIKNNITAIVGDGGVGKTFVWVDIASAISNNSMPAIMGIPFDTKTPNTDGNNKVLYFTSEDSTAETLKERFEKAGADLKNLLFVPLEDECFHKITLESAELEEYIKQAKPVLCVLDPLQSFVKGKMADRNNMRRQLDCLTRLASIYNVSFLIIVHTNKLATSDARTKLSDSSDIWDKCRSVLFVGKTKESKIRYLSQEKGNYTSDENEQATHLFTIKDGKVEECGTTSKKYYDFATESTFSKDTSIRDDAKEFILTTLIDKEMPVAELEEIATSYGIKSKTFERAKADLNKENKIKYTRKSAGYGKGVQVFVSLNNIS